MQRGWIAAVLAPLLFAAISHAQYQPPVENLSIQARSAATWTQDTTSVVQLDGPVAISLDQITLKAKSAVVWLSPIRQGVIDEQQAQIALIGDASANQNGITRSGPSLIVTAIVRGDVRITADSRTARDLSSSDLYKTAVGIRSGKNLVTGEPPTERRATTVSTTTATTRKARELTPMSAQFKFVQTVDTDDHHVAAVLSGGVLLIYRDNSGGLLQFQAERAVLFSTLRNLKDAKQSDVRSIQEATEAVYIEGDARIVYSPANAKMGEQRLTAERAYYELATDRAVLTDAVFHTTDPRRGVPAIMRAQTIRMMSRQEFTAEHVQLTTSEFATPSLSIAAERAYVRQIDTGDPQLGVQTNFNASDVTMRAWGVPFFYFPAAGGSITERGIPLRDLQFGNSSRFGPTVRTEWGLFESLGQPPLHDMDVAYRLDYYGDRGPAAGLNADYGGGFITETTREPWNFEGDFRSYFVYDHGHDEFGENRTNVNPPYDFRGHMLLEHQHFFPEDWQVQLRVGYVSDATFLEEYFEREWNSNEQPHDVSLYLKQQTNTQAITFGANFQPNNFVTTSDQVQEQFEVEREPQLGFHRIGDSFGGDNFTFFSDNSLAGLRFNRSGYTLAEQGFNNVATPGLPSQGLVGATGPPRVSQDQMYRGDFRQEIDYPFTAGEFKVVPYVVGRYTGYSNSPNAAEELRPFAGTGVRVTTAFWAVDDSVKSDLFDLHRLRHVIEPELHLFTSAQSVDPAKLYVWDEDVDRINDISAIQLGLHQRWQTQRGGPGRWRSVDVFTLNIEGNFFANKPPTRELNPAGFRGLFFDSLPEASIPRDSINSDATWRVSDSTVMLADAQYNAIQHRLATASIGMAVRHDPHVSYFFGTRYIELLNSNITTISTSYELSRKYTMILSESFDFSQNDDVGSSIAILRKFDAFFMMLRVYYDARSDQSGFTINIAPNGLANQGVSSEAFNNVFQPQRR